MSANEELETLCESRVVSVSLGKRRHLYRIVSYECRLNQVLLAVLAEDSVDEFAYAH